MKLQETGGRDPLTPERVLTRIVRSKDGPLFDAVFTRGDLSRYHGDHSKADFDMARKLAFWTGGDAVLMDALFRQSALYWPKWDRKRAACRAKPPATPGQRLTPNARRPRTRLGSPQRRTCERTRQPAVNEQKGA